MSEERKIDDRDLGKVTGGKDTSASKGSSGSGSDHDMPGAGDDYNGPSEIGPQN